MKQPKALKILFFTEMWERFGFYTTQAMLIFYLMEKLSFSDADAYAVLGQFTALVYLGPVIGGWAADKFLGCRFAVMLGGLFLSLGYALLALGTHTLFTGLSFVILGGSLLKPNISSFLGQFYQPKDPRRDGGFTLFYVGINIGVFLSTSSAGYTQKYLGWGACFGIASFALILGVLVFQWGYRYFEDKGLPSMEHAQTLGTFLRKKPSLILWFCGALTFIYFSMTFIGLGSYGLYFSGLLFLTYVIKISWKMDALTRKRMMGLLILFVIATVFFGLWFQTFFVVNVFTERAVDRVIFGHELPTSVFLGLDCLFVLILGPILAKFWQSKRGQISIPVKFAIGLLLLAISMQSLASLVSEDSVLALSAVWLVLFYFILTAGEMLVSPIGLSMVTEYAPKEYASFMMGGFFMAIGFGGKLTGFLASYATVPEGVTDLHSLNSIYHQAFQQYAVIGFVMFLISLALIPLIKKWLND